MLGQTGMSVSAYCLGTMMFGTAGNTNRAEIVAMIQYALDSGINCIDTADVYSRGESEEIVGEALRGRRENVVLATKVSGKMAEDPNSRGGSRRWLIREIESSLRRLRTDYIDIYQVHRPDPYCDLDETLSAMSDLVHAGKVRVVGTSGFPPESIVEAQWIAEKRGHVRVRCEQPQYSLFCRSVELAVLPTCARYGLGVITYSPLAGGWLTGRYRKGAFDCDGRAAKQPRLYDPRHPSNSGRTAAVEDLLALSEEVGCSLPHLALAFVMAHPFVTSAIVGPRTMEQLRDILSGARLGLSDAILDRIDEIVPPGQDLGPSGRTSAFGHTDAGLRRRSPTQRRATLS